MQRVRVQHGVWCVLRDIRICISNPAIHHYGGGDANRGGEPNDLAKAGSLPWMMEIGLPGTPQGGQEGATLTHSTERDEWRCRSSPTPGQAVSPHARIEQR